MKLLKLKPQAEDFKWLPPAEEWDFRSVTEGECRVACHWEYERQDSRSTSKLGGQKYVPVNYHQAARELFPQAWTTLTREQRAKVVESFLPSPVIQVRKLREYLKRMPVNGANPEIFQAFLHQAYVIVPNFRGHGVEAVIKEFAKWARQEAKQHPPTRRAQAAELPFDALKWLAVLRLDAARRMAGVTIERARETVRAYRQKHPHATYHGDVFPVYASDGAWSKARKDATKCQAKAKINPSFLLAELA